MGLADTARLAVKLDLEGNFGAGLQKASGQLTTFDNIVTKTAGKVGHDLAHGARVAAQNIERLALAGAGLAIGGGAVAVKWAGDFEAGMNTINSVALATPAILAAAGEGIRRTFRETGTAMADLQAAEYDLVSAGVKLTDAQEGVNQAVKLGIGALGTTSEAVDVLTTAINSYNLKAADGTVQTGAFARVSDELAQAVADGKVKLSEIAATYSDVAAVAAQNGIGTNELAAAYGFLTAKGVAAAEVSTQLSRTIIELIKPSAALLDLQKKTHKTYSEIAADKGINVALEELRTDASKNGVAFQDLFGRVEAYKFALQTTGPNAAGFAAELDRINHSAGMTGKQFDERAQGLNYQLGRLKANVQDAGITIGSALLPQLTDLSKEASDFLRGHQQDIADFGKNLAGGFRDAVAWAKRLDLAGIADSLHTAATFGKGLIQAFADAPPWLQQAVVTGWGLNKLTGGAVVNVGADLAKGFAANFLTRGSSPANPLYVSGVGVGGAGGSGGSIIGGIGTLGGIALIAEQVAALPGVVSSFMSHDFRGVINGLPSDTVPGADLLKALVNALPEAKTGDTQRAGDRWMDGVQKLTSTMDAGDRSWRANTDALRANTATLEAWATGSLSDRLKHEVAPGSQVNKWLHSALRIATSSESTDKKIAELTRIQKDLREGGHHQVYFLDRLLAVEKAKKTTVNVSVSTSVSLSDVTRKISIRQTYRTSAGNFIS